MKVTLTVDELNILISNTLGQMKSDLVAMEKEHAELSNGTAIITRRETALKGAIRGALSVRDKIGQMQRQLLKMPGSAPVALEDRELELFTYTRAALEEAG